MPLATLPLEEQSFDSRLTREIAYGLRPGLEAETRDRHKVDISD